MKITHNHIRQSNLIEGIDDPAEDKQSTKAWRYLEKQDHLSQPVLLELHRLITKNQLPEGESGAYRKVNVTVGGRLCPEPFLATQLIYNWLYDMLEYDLYLNPKEMHIRFERIHPFVDGNGRTGRMLMWWHELKRGDQPTLILDSNKLSYYRWFA